MELELGGGGEDSRASADSTRELKKKSLEIIRSVTKTLENATRILQECEEWDRTHPTELQKIEPTATELVVQYYYNDARAGFARTRKLIDEAQEALANEEYERAFAACLCAETCAQDDIAKVGGFAMDRGEDPFMKNDE